MIKAMIVALALTLSLPVGAAENHREGQQNAPADRGARPDSLGGGSACKDGKCGHRNGCCCAAKMKKGACRMGHGQMEGMHGAGDEMAYQDMMERVQKLEQRVEQMQKMLLEQQPKG